MRASAAASRAVENEEQYEDRLEQMQKMKISRKYDTKLTESIQSEPDDAVVPSELALAAFNYDPHLDYQNCPDWQIGQYKWSLLCQKV